MRRAGERLAWLALALGALVLVRSPQGGSEAASSGKTTRFLAFRMSSPSDGLSFVLDPAEREVKLLTWLVQPHRPLADSRVTTPYALSLALSDAAGTARREDRFWLRARGGFVSSGDGLAYRPNWLEGSDEDVSDDLLTRLDLERPDDGRATLTLRPAWLPPGSRVLLAVFSQRPRSAASALRVSLGDDPSLRERLAARFMPFGWEEVPEAWTANLLSTRWLRLPALGEDPPTEELLTTGEREPWDDAPALGVLVPPGGAVAYNLEGGPALRATWYGADRRPLRARSVRAQVRIVHVDGTATVLAPPPSTTLGPLQGDPTICSVQIALDPSEPEPRYLVASTQADGAGRLDRAWGDPPRRPVDPRGAQALGPDLRDLILYRTDGAASPLRYGVRDPREIGRLSFRIPLPLTALQGLQGAAVAPIYGPHVVVRARAADGAVLATWSHDVRVVPSLFERYVQTLDRAAAVSEPDEVYVVPPAGAATLEVSADGPIDVGLRMRRPEPINRQEYRDYALPEEARVDARYVPWARDRWHARVPEDTEDLLAQGREIRVDAQVRLDRAREDDPTGEGWAPSELASAARPRRPGTPHTLPLPGPFQIVAEPASRGSHASNGRSAIGPSPVSLELPASGDLRVDYRVPPGDVGRTVTFKVGGRALTRALATAGGQILLSGLPPGRAEVSLEGPAGIWLAQAPGGEGWATRRVVQLSPGGSLRVSLPQRGGALALLPYAEVGARTQGALRWSLGPDELSLPGIYASFSELQGSLALSRSPERLLARPLSWAGAGLAPLSPARLWLADNLPEGASLRLSLSDDATPVWVRAIASWSAASSPAPQHGRVRSAP